MIIYNIYNNLKNSFFNYRIRYGSKSRLTSPFDDLEIKHIRLHPDFDLSNVQNDIALFILKSPIVPSSNVRAIELQTTEIEVDTNMTLYGFGLTNGMGNAPSIKLQKTYLQILNETQCSDFITNLGITKGPGMMCAAAPERSACNVSDNNYNSNNNNDNSNNSKK